MRVTVLTKIPSPYQVELFNALAASPDLQLTVLYLKDKDPDRGWAPQELRHAHLYLAHESAAASREIERCDLAVFGWYQDGVGELIRRRVDSGKPWSFWGERPGFRGRGLIGAAYRRFALRLLHRDERVPIWGIGEWAVEGYRTEFGALRPYRSVPYVSDLDPFVIQSAVTRQGPLKILFSGALIKRKGVLELCEAFCCGMPDRREIRLHIMGSGPLEPQLRAIAARDDRVTFLGFRDWKELPSAYGSADLLCAPSRYDGWGMIVPEALAAGMPVIATTNMGSAREIVSDGRTGWLVPPSDKNALLSALVAAVARGREGLVEMGRRGAQVVRWYSIDSGVSRFVAAATDAIEREQRERPSE